MYPLLFSLRALGVGEVIAVGGLLSGTGDPVLAWRCGSASGWSLCLGLCLSLLRPYALPASPAPSRVGRAHLFPSAHPGACGGRPF